MPLLHLVRQASALVMAAGMVIHYVYIPSEHNPADAPSRGIPQPGAGDKQRRATASNMQKIEERMAEPESSEEAHWTSQAVWRGDLATSLLFDLES